MTDEDLVDRYVKLRNTVAVMAARAEEAAKPYTAAMETVAAELHSRLIARGAESTKTGAGIAYLSTTYRVNVSDRDALVAHVLETGNLSMFSNSLSKEAVEDYMESHDGVLPPGIARTGFTKINVRKS